MRFLLPYLLLLTALPAAAQQPMYRHITEDDGLPDNEIYYLHQDRAGAMWISTNSGLCRYNGHSFRYYSHPQLKAKSTGCIQEDSFGRIWVNNFSGQLFYVQGDSLVLAALPGNRSINSNAPFLIGPGNQMIVSTENDDLALYRAVHQKPGETPVYLPDTVLQAMSVNPLFAGGTLWATTGKPGYLKMGAAAAYRNGVLEFYKTEAGNNPANRQTGFIFEQGGSLFYHEREKSSLYRFNGSSFTTWQHTGLPGFKLVRPLRSGGLALCTNSGLYLTYNTTVQPGIRPLFPGQTISAFCEDSNGNLWAGTLTEGIYLIPHKGLSLIRSTRSGIDFSNVTDICTGPGNQLILGFLNGELGVLDEKLNYRSLYPANPLSVKVQSLFYSAELQLLNWNSNWIYQSAFTGTEQRLRPYRGIGYASKDIAYLPRLNAALVANPIDIQLISLDKTLITQKMPPGWAARYDTVTIFNHTMPWPQQSIFLSKERGRAVHYDEKTGTMWGADKNGVTLYRNDGKKNLLLNGSPVYATSFCEYNGMVWTGTFSQGLIGFKDEKPVKQYLAADGLAGNTVLRIVAGRDCLWLLTEKGLQQLRLSDGTFYMVDKSLGLPSYKINAMAIAGNTLFISTPKGLLSMPASLQPGNDARLQVRLQAVYCNGRPADTARSKFGTRENDFTFTAEIPLFTSRTLLRYRYRLYGADKDYRITGTDTEVFEYKSLQPGSYRFELQLVDTRGRSIGNPVTYSFSIQPPFYRTAWFIAPSLLLLALALYWAVRRRIKRLQQRSNEKLQLAQLETALKQSQLTGIKAQMNPHFMFNALNSIQEFILLNDRKQANMYLGRFADLMRLTLDMSNRQNVLLEDEIKMLELYLQLEALRFEENFSWHITTAPEVDTANTYLPAMLIQPNIENAVKHGLLHRSGEKKLEVLFAMKDAATLCCTITDNGIGRKRSGEINAQRNKKHASFATGATQKRLELLNHGKQRPITLVYHDLTDKYGNAAGTRVEINIPLHP